MKLPPWWSFGRPGIIIPVFFLSFFSGRCQVPAPSARVSALGGSFASQVLCCGGKYNQAGLARYENTGISLYHAQPFAGSGLYAIGFAGVISAADGAIGMALDHMGFPGLHHHDLWLSYGLRVHKEVMVGAGIHLHHSYAHEPGHSLGLGFALGVQWEITQELQTGIHLNYPRVWPTSHPHRDNALCLTAGLSYAFFGSASLHADLSFSSLERFRWSQGLEIPLHKRIHLLLGCHTNPSSLSTGIEVHADQWDICVSAAQIHQLGWSPSCTLHYAW